MPKRGRERRRPVNCPHCGREMICTSRLSSIQSKLTKSSYIWYICPRRKRERGCGQSVLMQISPKTKRPERVICSVKVEKLLQKRKPKK